MVSFQLQDVMKLRDIEGTLIFDNEAETLDIQAIPRDKECANVVSKTSNLSGGERSYTTVAFLLSLWSCVDHPFYFLDEYDVFTVRITRLTNSDAFQTFHCYKKLHSIFRIKSIVCSWRNCCWMKQIKINLFNTHSSRLKTLLKLSNPRIFRFCGKNNGCNSTLECFL